MVATQPPYTLFDGPIGSYSNAPPAGSSSVGLPLDERLAEQGVHWSLPVTGAPAAHAPVASALGTTEVNTRRHADSECVGC